MNSNEVQIMKLLPTINDKGELTMAFDYQLMKGDSRFIQNPSPTLLNCLTVVIASTTDPKRAKEVLALITVKVVE